MKYKYLFLCFSFVILGITGVASAADNLKKIHFSYNQSGTTYHLARAALAKTIFPLEVDINRKVILFTAREDLNGDDVPELLVRLADKKFFCDEEKGCETYIFAVTGKGTQEIGSFKANEVYIEDKFYNSAKRLQIKSDKKDSFEEFVWENGQYVAYNRKG